MTLTAPEVDSLSTALGSWETAEYISTALVVLACAGEYFAEFTTWFTGGNEKKKHLLNRRSTLLLVAALAVELICLVKTNQLSGTLIGSLSDLARKALIDSKEAVSKSGNAQNSARSAELSSKTAVESSGKALASASNALGLAAGARQEADSFEHDIELAKNQAAEAASQVIEASKRAHEATLLAQQEDTLRRQLEFRLADRVITADQQRRIAEAARNVKGLSATVVKLGDTPDINNVFARLVTALHDGDCPMNFLLPMSSPVVAHGIIVGFKPGSPKEVVFFANALVNILNETLRDGANFRDFGQIPTTGTGTINSDGKPPAPDSCVLRIVVASK